MILDVKNALSRIAPKLTYDVLIENQEDGTIKATLLSLPECQGLGATKEEALNNLIQLFQARKPEIVTLEIEPPQTEHPWMRFAGMHKNNPLVDEVIASMEEERNALDLQIQESHTKLINEIEEELGELSTEPLMCLIHLRHRNQSIKSNDAENNL
ncbi:hypothetical protein A0J48_008480 [Sphaerospermopsis aphanizomenoides BCCUSP55]|uniref:type II toxin-antitoxin system HicB family antitoxin n=1 Tax=Sphaerospermopsis aphanizomenoides TaxID=459663 RepID=UPI0019030026|nr:hypothetical protein [Sphaerospermopsis aphanizomenoides]MBK1987572.1 hypothetical protein [Sphaerospermopsis aphanizomenoides BCCUSP55]